MKTLYTLGTDRRTEEDFIEILLSYGISSLIDVRSFPKSKFRIYSRENLEPLLNSNGISYHWLGHELGGFRRGGYEAHTKTELFGQGISMLEEIAAKGTSVIVCAERFPWKCHRRWIAKEMHKRGWHVVHIIEKGKLWEPAS